MNAEFVDTNIVLYSLSDDVTKRRQALAILVDQPVLSLQVLNEAANVMRRKLGFDIPAIREVLLRWLRETRLHSSGTINSAIRARRSGSLWFFSLRQFDHRSGSGVQLHYAVLRRLAAWTGD
ncbi:MAG: hypothetical protein IPL99_22470 [Candidatus Competibacteraceae bacterium]|nr:hypothetical protein [Candidatus Competibacteraceae bacterium]